MATVYRSLLWMTVLAVTACGRHPRAYVIGAAGPQQLALGKLNQEGIDLAIDEINRGGGIHGVPLRVETRDDHASITAVQIAADFVANPAVIAVVGHVQSGPMVAAAHIYSNGRLVAVGTTPSSPDLTGISPWVFRMISSDSTNGITLAAFASSFDRSLKRPVVAAVLYENNAYGRGLAEVFQRNFQGTIISSDPVGAKENVEPYVTYYMRRKPDLVFMASTQDIGLAFVHEARRQHFPGILLGGDGWQSMAFDPLTEGIYVGTPFTNQDPDTAVQRFVVAFQARYGQLPDDHSAFGYDATRMLAQAIAAVGPNRRRVRDYLASLSSAHPFQSISGPLSFTATHDPVESTFRITKIHNGLLIPVAWDAQGVGAVKP